MRISLLSRLAVVAGVFTVWCSAKETNPLERITPVPADAPIPAIDFFRPPVFAAPVLNPAGTHFAASVSTDSDRRDVIVYDLATNKIDRLTGGRDTDIVSYTWLNDQRFLFRMSQDKMYAAGLFTAELGRLEHPVQIQRIHYAELIGVPKDDPLKPILWIQNGASMERQKGELVQVDATRMSNGDATVVYEFPVLNEDFPEAFYCDIEGHLAFGVTVNEGRWNLHRLADGKWKKAPAPVDDLEIVGPGEKPGELFVLGPREEGKPRAFQTLDVATGELGPVVYRDDGYDLDGVAMYRDRYGKLLGLHFDQKLPKDVWVDPLLASIQQALEQTFSGLVVRLIGSDRAHNRFLVAVRSDTTPVCYYRFDKDTRELKKISQSAPWIDPQRMNRMRGLTFVTRDGVKLDAYVTLPAGASKEHPVPMVVLPHGGPRARDVWGWDPEVQFLASRGYAVLQPNYRGSTGYGWRYPKDDRWAYRKMHDDVTDAVTTVLKTGLIDRDRLAIMGSSFGGYLAICGAAYEPDLYRCAITIAGVFDWEKIMEEARRNRNVSAEYDYLRLKLGDPKKDKEKFEAMSPLRQVDKIKIPVYVAHGVGDFIVPVEQSKRLISELKRHGIPYEKQIEWEEPHGFLHLQTQVALYTAIEAFLKKNLEPRVAAKR